MRKPSDAMVAVLARIRTLKTEHGACGMFPYGPGQWATMMALKRRGLVRFVGTGRDIDGEREGVVPIFDMTPEGERVLGAIEPAPRTPPDEGTGTTPRKEGP